MAPRRQCNFKNRSFANGSRYESFGLRKHKEKRRIHWAKNSIKGLEHLPYTEKWGYLGLMSLEKRFRGILLRFINTYWNAMKKRQPGSSQSCLWTKEEALGTDQKTRNAESLLLCSNTEIGCRDRLWSLRMEILKIQLDVVLNNPP